jgi:hypothetical protein
MPAMLGLRWRSGLLAPLLLGVLLLGPAMSHERAPPLARLGKVDFRVECNAAAQEEFHRAMALYHSFAWKEATEAFDAVSKADPSCGMAHWGRAMTMLDNPFVWPVNLPPKTLSDALAALEAARAAGLRSERERDYVEALAVFLRDHDKLNHRDRLQSLEAAMATLAARYPDDTEASILSALVTSANFNPADKTYANQYKAAKILEPLFAARPDHPGVAHYLIHSYDYPPLAKHGLEAAKRYAQVAPDAPHALHMPSHIFTRLGYWQESIEANRASAKTASPDTYYPHHAYDYMVYAHLQLAQDRAARQATEQSLATKAIDNNAAAFAYAAMPARLALERGEWEEAGRLALHPGADAYPWKKYPHAEAINAFVRGVGLARSGDSSAAMAQHARLVTLRNAAKEAKLGYWADQIDIQAEVVRGLSLVADGKTAEGVAILNDAAQREDATEKHVVTPGPLLPAREVLAEVFLEAGNSDAALIQYEAVLAKEPNRYRATFGAARAAHLSGDAEKARVRFTQLVELAQSADTERDSLQEARRFLAQK